MISHDVVWCDAMRCDAMRCDAMRCDAMQWHTLEDDTMSHQLCCIIAHGLNASLAACRVTSQQSTTCCAPCRVGHSRRLRAGARLERLHGDARRAVLGGSASAPPSPAFPGADPVLERSSVKRTRVYEESPLRAPADFRGTASPISCGARFQSASSSNGIPLRTSVDAGSRLSCRVGPYSARVQSALLQARSHFENPGALYVNIYLSEQE